MSTSREKQDPIYKVPAGKVPVFQTAICECLDINASTMALDATGRFALVSGRKCMGLIDLEGGPSNRCNPSQLGNLDETPKLAPICKRYVRNSKYEPTSSHFNRHQTDFYALSSYQVVEVFSVVDMNPIKAKLTLRGHSRAIADVEWSHFDAHLLGSAAADCLTNIWDIRDSRRPSACLTSVSGATLVRFCKTSSNLIATSHEIDVRIWDIRQPNLPLNYIAAHLQKIHGMDWSPNKGNFEHEQLITCSQDNTIKSWDLTPGKIRPSAILQTRTPAWRIRYTPISPYAILTSTLPQLRSRAECMALKLWSMKSSRYEQRKLELILGLVGHSDVIIDFDWRHQARASGSCEIVSWSKDQTLRVWRVDNQFIEMNVDNSDYEHECDTQISSNDHSQTTTGLATIEERSFSSTNMPNLSLGGDEEQSRHSPSPSARPVSRQSCRSPQTRPPPDSQQQQQQQSNDKAWLPSEQDDDGLYEGDENASSTINELRQEFNLINKNIPNLEFEELNSLRRICLVVARSKNVTCRLRIALPPNYPQSACPTFTIIDSHQYGADTLSADVKEKLILLLDETAKAQLNRSHNCIEPCLRKFIAALQKITNHAPYRRRGIISGGGGAWQSGSIDIKEDPITLSAQRDHSVPFPPTSGARFCGNLLVCFGRPLLPTINNTTSNDSGASDSTSFSVETPRSMAQLSAQLDNMRRQGSYNLSNISISYFYYGAMRRAELQSRTSTSSQRSISSGIASSRASSGGNTTGPSTKYLSSRNRANALGSHSMMAKNFKCGPVIVYDVSNLLGGISKELAEDYVFDKDVIKMCRRNSEIAAAHNRRDLVQIWSLAELSSEGVLRSYVPSSLPKGQDDEDHSPMSFVSSRDSDFGDRPWTMHPFGSKLIQSLIDHYVYNCHDVQTAAMLVWTFSSPKLGHQTRTSKQNFKTPASVSITNSSNLPTNKAGKTYSEALSTGGNRLNQNNSKGPSTQTSDSATGRHNTANSHTTDATPDEWSFVNGPETHLYSNSWSNSTSLIDENQWSEGTANKAESQLAASCGITDDNMDLEQCVFPKLNILSQDKSLQNDLIMHIYAELLYRLNLLNQRAMVLKNIGSNSAYSEIFGDKQILLNDVPRERLPNLVIQCSNQVCGKKDRSVQCGHCKKYNFYCSICRLPVKGSCSICMKCLHGGHVHHFSAWFDNYDFCPTGCGCRCPTVSHGRD